MIFSTILSFMSALTVVIGSNPVNHTQPFQYGSVNSTSIVRSQVSGASNNALFDCFSLTYDDTSLSDGVPTTIPYLSAKYRVFFQPNSLNTRFRLFIEFNHLSDISTYRSLKDRGFQEPNVSVFITFNLDATDSSLAPNDFQMDMSIYGDTTYSLATEFMPVNSFTSFNFTCSFVLADKSFDDYNDGYDDGYIDGNTQGYNDGYEDGQVSGYNRGYADALAHNGFTFTDLFGSIADTPILYLRRLFGFELFGVSLMSVFMSLFTALIVIHLIKKVF